MVGTKASIIFTAVALSATTALAAPSGKYPHQMVERSAPAENPNLAVRHFEVNLYARRYADDFKRRDDLDEPSFPEAVIQAREFADKELAAREINDYNLGARDFDDSHMDTGPIDMFDGESPSVNQENSRPKSSSQFGFQFGDGGAPNLSFQINSNKFANDDRGSNSRENDRLRFNPEDNYQANNFRKGGNGRGDGSSGKRDENDGPSNKSWKNGKKGKKGKGDLAAPEDDLSNSRLEGLKKTSKKSKGGSKKKNDKATSTSENGGKLSTRGKHTDDDDDYSRFRTDASKLTDPKERQRGKRPLDTLTDEELGKNKKSKLSQEDDKRLFSRGNIFSSKAVEDELVLDNDTSQDSQDKRTSKSTGTNTEASNIRKNKRPLDEERPKKKQRLNQRAGDSGPFVQGNKGDNTLDRYREKWPKGDPTKQNPVMLDTIQEDGNELRRRGNGKNDKNDSDEEVVAFDRYSHGDLNAERPSPKSTRTKTEDLDPSETQHGEWPLETPTKARTKGENSRLSKYNGGSNEDAEYEGKQPSRSGSDSIKLARSLGLEDDFFEKRYHDDLAF
ncbi:hypothetical protein AMATHDRAFT_62976 [Amanita thiersii Skay4041]|uniref:Uncharacterized protein n=1 Tax=Amanita thiersii Skay4041 TaxID=703135 RepID=A0A2A9NPC1_9AGAR|nr:hypothetical protein AMATHDRAFT_62976 [Amanita thiersii Skay4041]